MKGFSRGVTYIELIVYIAILVVVVSGATSFLLWTARLHLRSQSFQEVTDNASNALNTITREIRKSAGIYTPTTSSTQLSLATKEYMPAGESSSYIDFFLCGTALCLKKESQNPVVLTSDRVEVTSLQFQEVRTGLNRSSVQIAIGVEYKNPDNRPDLEASITLTSTASLRAY
ncbi:MAG: hypothetical protein HYV77_03610 [Candidatus Wildermuthbacteria bacterium]|nr:hypothetical protein [Candidatus Wildermuthbacteria bacterium]